jgi:hypothetical protein
MSEVIFEPGGKNLTLTVPPHSEVTVTLTQKYAYDAALTELRAAREAIEAAVGDHILQCEDFNGNIERLEKTLARIDRFLAATEGK